MSIEAIILALGGAKGILTIAQTLVSTGFRMVQLFGELEGANPLPLWSDIKERAENELTTAEQDKADLEDWLAKNPLP